MHLTAHQIAFLVSYGRTLLQTETMLFCGSISSGGTFRLFFEITVRFYTFFCVFNIRKMSPTIVYLWFIECFMVKWAIFEALYVRWFFLFEGSIRRNCEMFSKKIQRKGRFSKLRHCIFFLIWKQFKKNLRIIIVKKKC